MSNQNLPNRPVFQVSEKMYQQLLDWQRKQDKSSDKSIEKASDSTTPIEVDEKINRNGN